MVVCITATDQVRGRITPIGHASVSCTVLQYVAWCHSVLLCVAVCCCVLPCNATTSPVYACMIARGRDYRYGYGLIGMAMDLSVGCGGQCKGSITVLLQHVSLETNSWSCCNKSSNSMHSISLMSMHSIARMSLYYSCLRAPCSTHVSIAPMSLYHMYNPCLYITHISYLVHAYKPRKMNEIECMHVRLVEGI